MSIKIPFYETKVGDKLFISDTNNILYIRTENKGEMPDGNHKCLTYYDSFKDKYIDVFMNLNSSSIVTVINRDK